MLRNPCCRWAAPLVVIASLCVPAANAVEIKLARHPDYHNGKVVFSYLGDLWTVNEDGSNPKRLTVHRARDMHPRFSPDGKWIAFSSDRFGNYDVFVMPSEGGTAKQMTYHSGGDLVVGWSRDSKKVIFQSSRGMMYPGIPNLYEVPVAGGVEQPILTDWGYWGSYSPDGQKFAFNRHPMVWWRKHYRGSYAADLWTLDVAQRKFRRLGDDKTPDEEKANNLWPMYGQGGDIYFVSDRETKAKSGTPQVLQSVNNIWKVNDSTGQLTQVTHHKSGALFWPSMSADGKVIVYEENFGLCKLDCGTGKSTEIKIDITADDQDNNLEVLTFNGECDSYHVSPSGKRAVISIHGELFSVATDKGEIRRLTQTPHVREIQPAWSPDGKWIAFVGEKDGVEHVFVCDEKGGQVKQLSTGDSQKSQIRWAPNSSALLFTATDNNLYRCTLADGQTTVIAKGDVVTGEGAVSNPQWSPDGKWVSFTKSDRNMLAHVYVMPATAGGEAKRVTGHESFTDRAALWTPDGKYLVYTGSNDVGSGPISVGNKMTSQLYVLSLLPEDKDRGDKNVDSEEEALKKAAGGKGQKGDKAEVEVKIDFTKIGRRTRALTKAGDNVGNVAITPDSKTVVFTTSGVEGGRNVQSIWSISIDGGTATRVVQAAPQDPEGAAPPPGKKGGGGAGGGLGSLQFAKEGRTLFYKQGKSIYVTNLGGGGATDGPAPAAKGAAQGGGGAAATGGKKVNFVAKVEVDHRAQRRQVFLEAWRVMKHRFYDAKLHGADWDKVRATYEPLLAHVADTEELHNVINYMLGELNASHTGVSGGGKAGGASNTTRHPGFEMEPDKSGYYKVTHVYKNGPCDKDYVKLNVGDFILACNEQPLKSGDNYWKVFTHTPTGRFEFMVNSKPAADGAWTVKIMPINVGQLGNLQYEKWVDERRAMVDQKTNGQIGYLHIRQMDEKALRQFERDLAMLGGKKAIVIDQRFNPGGNIDQELLTILQQKQYQLTKQRGSTEVTRPLRAFFGPMVVMANERSTSDAEVFPDGFKTLKLGKVVGVTTYGAVIGTGSHQLMDGSTLRTPGSGLWNVNGTNLENNGIVPDVYVDNSPEDFFNRRDAQLEKAIEVLQQELAMRK
jgi:tricorn protease